MMDKKAQQYHQFILSECKRQWKENQEEDYGTWFSQSDYTKAEYYNELYQQKLGEYESVTQE